MPQQTTLAEKLAWTRDTLAQTAALLAGGIDAVNQSIEQEKSLPGGSDKPAAPTGYAMHVLDSEPGERSVLLQWTDPPENADAYQLEGLPALAADATSYRVTGLAPGSTYAAPRLRRLGSADNSDWVTADPPTIQLAPLVVEDVPAVPGDPPQPAADAFGAGDLYSKYPGPPQGAQTINFDADVTKLSPGVYAMKSGQRAKPLTGLKTGVMIWAATQYGVEYNGKGLAFHMIGNSLNGFRFRGIGQGEKLNDKCGGFVGNDSTLSYSEFLDAVGVAASFGYKDGGSVKGASGATCQYNRFVNCGSAGFGGKGKNSVVRYNYFENNNAKVGDTDGAGAGKYTHSDNVLFANNTVINATGTSVWWDIENKRCACKGNLFDGCRTLKDVFRQRGIVFEWSEDGPFEVSGNLLRNIAVPILVEETTGMTVANNQTYRVDRDKDVACDLHLRDYYQDGSKLRDGWTANKRLKKLTVVGNVQLNPKYPGEILVARSGSGTKFSKDDLKSWGCEFQPEVKYGF